MTGIVDILLGMKVHHLFVTAACTQWTLLVVHVFKWICKLAIASTEAVVQNKLAFIKLTPEIAATCLAELEEVLALRANFDKEMGESQVATVSKNVALHNLITDEKAALIRQLFLR